MRTHRLSGTHITVMVVAICVAVVAAPVTVMAAGSLVTITDPTNGNSAKVSAKNSLLTSVRDVTTGAYGKVDSSGRQLVTGPVTVSNSITARPGKPSLPVTNSLGNGLTVPADKTLIAESLSLQTTVSTGGRVQVLVRYTTGGTQAYLFLPTTSIGNSGGYDYHTAAVPVKFTADPGTQVYAQVYAMSGSLGGSTFLTVNGYLV